MKTVLQPNFFARSAPEVAVDLLGKYLVRYYNGTEIASLIVETEAYEGVDDLASHASKGKTPRTEVMFGPPGRWYIYLIYGLHYMLNVVTNEAEQPSAVLIRGVEHVSGPGRVTRYFSITKDLNTKPALKISTLWFEDRGVIVTKKEVHSSPRIGVPYAGPIWSKKPWRFIYRVIN